jgi:hypothetical protein
MDIDFIITNIHTGRYAFKGADDERNKYRADSC